MLFYLGAHHPHWLSEVGVPLFVSRRRLAGRKTLPKAAAQWALDSGGFSEIRQFGRWTVSEDEYADEIERFQEEIGLLDWVAPQDWMCEPEMLQRTGLTVLEHQVRSTRSYASMKNRGLPVIPVLQGWELPDYVLHARLYRAWGFDLPSEPVVGLGSVCRRQGMDEAEEIVRCLSDLGMKLHGFGFKKTGLKRCSDVLASADSMAWSYAGRRAAPMERCVGHKNCANCKRYALRWRDELLGEMARAA